MGPHFAGLNSVPVSWNEVWRVLPKRLDSTQKGIAICHESWTPIFSTCLLIQAGSVFHVCTLYSLCIFFHYFLSLYLLYVYKQHKTFFITCKFCQTQRVLCYFSFPPPLFCLRQPYQGEGGEPATHQKGQASQSFKKLGASKDRGMVRTSTGGWFRNPGNPPVDMVIIVFFPLFFKG